MKKLLILSGKGGTGKTTTAAAFSAFAKARAVADCDVDAPNLHLILGPFAKAPETEDFKGSDKARIDPSACIGCGRCAEHCRFGAIQRQETGYGVDEFSCEGCGVCALVCPASAVTMHQDVAGQLRLYRGEPVFSEAELKTGRGNSGKLVSQVKQALLKAKPKGDLAVIDGSPGIGCPVISSVSGMDLVLIVAEPSLSGLSDLQRLLKTAGILNAKAAVCVNKWDAAPEISQKIQQFCQAQNVPFLGRIPYDKRASQAINEGLSLADIDCPARDALYQVYLSAMALMPDL